jgi:hypothetical protein
MHRSFEIENSYLFFANPHIPYAVEHLSDIGANGYLFLCRIIGVIIKKSPVYQ